MKHQLTNAKGAKIVTSPYGARLVSIVVPDHAGQMKDVIQGFDTLEEYKNKSQSQGAICGRFANRIAGAQFQLNGKTYHLPANDGNHCLHGGPNGLNNQSWDLIQEQPTIHYRYYSPHLESGFPGNVQFDVIYQFTDDCEVIIKLQATTDQPTPINTTSHPYFNLTGEGNGLIHDHEVKIEAEQFVEIDETSIPTGNLVSVEDTAFDFRNYQALDGRLSDSHPQIQQVNGFDHSFVMKHYQPGKVVKNAVVRHHQTGISLTVLSDYPALQFYTANTLHTEGKGGTEYLPHSSFCFEPQYFPDSPNQPQFPNTILQPGQTYDHTIIYSFNIFDQ